MESSVVSSGWFRFLLVTLCTCLLVGALALAVVRSRRRFARFLVFLFASARFLFALVDRRRAAFEILFLSVTAAVACVPVWLGDLATAAAMACALLSAHAVELLAGSMNRGVLPLRCLRAGPPRLTTCLCLQVLTCP